MSLNSVKVISVKLKPMKKDTRSKSKTGAISGSTKRALVQQKFKKKKLGKTPLAFRGLLCENKKNQQQINELSSLATIKNVMESQIGHY